MYCHVHLDATLVYTLDFDASHTHSDIYLISHLWHHSLARVKSVASKSRLCRNEKRVDGLDKHYRHIQG